MTATPASTRRRTAPAVAMTVAVLAAIALIAALPFQLVQQASIGEAAPVSPELREQVLTESGLLSGALTDDVPVTDTLAVLEETPEGDIAFAVVTEGGALVIGVITRGSGSVSTTSNPGERAKHLDASVGLPDGSFVDYDLTVRRTTAGYEHTFTAE